MTNFTITKDHLTLLRHAYVGWEECEYGAPAIDCKRPYGNSSVETDIADILGWETRAGELTTDQRVDARELHEQTQTTLQIILLNLPDFSGTYEKADRYDARSWRKL